MHIFIILCIFTISILEIAVIIQAAPKVVVHNITEAPPLFVPLDHKAKAAETINPLYEQVPVANAANVQQDAAYWQKIGLEQLKKVVESATKYHDNGYKNKAKNIIIFIGDGMGISTITAGRIYKSQFLKNGLGEEEKLSFDEFPYTGLAKTYNVDKQVPDSAGTATALFCGVKSHYGAIGVDATRSQTDSSKGRLTSIMDWAQAEGKRTGIVTTTRITHATPSATYARIYHRDWECDTEVPAESVGKHIDIARQLVENAPGNKFNVIMGGGLSPMGALNKQETRKVNFEGNTEKICTRNDSRNLAEEWLNMGNSNATKNDSRVFVKSIEELNKLNLKNVDHLLGLFRNNHITYALAKEQGEPSIKEMTEAAIRVLERGTSSKGYVLMVEGGRIDQGHHQNYAHAALHELYEFDQAIAAALNITNDNETLILVTADHSHAVTLNGYPTRGSGILGFGNKDGADLIYETISYANGPGYWDHLANQTQNVNSSSFWIPLQSLTKEQRMAPTYRHKATLPLKDETHGGEEVAVYAHGPGASLVRGTFEQNYIAYVMSYAGCMGPAKSFDDTCSRTTNANTNNSSAKGLSSNIVYSLLILLSLHWLS